MIAALSIEYAELAWPFSSAVTLPDDNLGRVFLPKGYDGSSDEVGCGVAEWTSSYRRYLRARNQSQIE